MRSISRPVVFGLQILLTNETGGAHDAGDVASWLSATGFVDVTITPLFPHIAIMARKADIEPGQDVERSPAGDIEREQ